MLVYEKPVGRVTWLLGFIDLRELLLRHQWNHCTTIRMEDRRTQHLVRIGDRAVAVFLVQARVTVDGMGGEIPGAIQGDQIMAVEKHHGFKCLPTLELSQDELERRSQGRRRDGIE